MRRPVAQNRIQPPCPGWILFCRYRGAVETVHRLIRKGYHGGGIISVRSSDLPRVGYRLRTDPGLRRLRLPSQGSSMHGRPFMGSGYVVQRPGPAFSPVIVDNCRRTKLVRGNRVRLSSRRVTASIFRPWEAGFPWGRGKYRARGAVEFRSCLKVLEGRRDRDGI